MSNTMYKICYIVPFVLLGLLLRYLLPRIDAKIQKQSIRDMEV